MRIFNIRFPIQRRKEAIAETDKILKKLKYPFDKVRSIDETISYLIDNNTCMKHEKEKENNK